MGERVAHLVTGRMLDFITYGVTVVGIKRPGADFTHATAETVVHPGDVIIVTGRTRAVEVFAELRAQ
ncbi:TrkA C-terminal domain-containing protein [Streptomyces sp. DT2A-34]|uniref:TrkA C-terminal domain-containing protein n=1 Tax=Streptomyces sp. DT2A-34 TaxID=3051182 RepID=UPI00265C10C0|nr:TrkA C-terminal domain-containing protein [Streptomyces sp. DT2A-34]MDO0910536.1 TrkA C-terminal domain-containing protein [Streptomyces sp. DT2A-34]